MEEALKKLLQGQGYCFAGTHSAVKLCTWTKKSLRDKGYCYKEKFYGIKSHLCCQMSPAVGYCQNLCVYCWRETDTSLGTRIRKPDAPAPVVENAILCQRKLLSGFGGDPDVNKKKLEESQDPKHFAISLTGDPLIYPLINKLIKEIHKQKKTTFLVTNGLLPERMASLEPPTQLYISIEAPNRELHKKVTRSLLKDAWERQQKSLAVWKGLRTTKVLRITAIKGLNMTDIEGYAALIRKAEPDYVEVKAYMFVGSSRQRLSLANMPLHPEIQEFSLAIAEASGYRIKDEKKESRVVLLSR
jgi:tRNA wybutosine-synthesizing protein 1